MCSHSLAAIARTLHISASNLRVPRSPPHAPVELLQQTDSAESESDNDSDSPVAHGLVSRQMSPTHMRPAKQPSSAAISRPLQVLAVGTILVAVFLQWFTKSSNVHTALRLAEDGPYERPAALVLTAHPDDEVMFFAPTILNLASTGWDIMAVCVSDGKCLVPPPRGGVRVAETGHPQFIRSLTLTRRRRRQPWRCAFRGALQQLCSPRGLQGQCDHYPSCVSTALVGSMPQPAHSSRLLCIRHFPNSKPSPADRTPATCRTACPTRGTRA